MCQIDNFWDFQYACMDSSFPSFTRKTLSKKLIAGNLILHCYQLMPERISQKFVESKLSAIDKTQKLILPGINWFPICFIIVIDLGGVSFTIDLISWLLFFHIVLSFICQNFPIVQFLKLGFCADFHVILRAMDRESIRQ